MRRGRIQNWQRQALMLAALTAPALCSVGVVQNPPLVRVAILHGVSGLHQSAAAALANQVRMRGWTCEVIELPREEAARKAALQRLVRFQPTVIATGGSAATQAALQAVPDVPVIFFMVPNALDAEFLADDHPDRARVAGVTSDVAPKRQMEWVARTQPRAKRLAVLCSARSQKTAEAVQQAGRTRGITVTPISATRDKFPEAIEALNHGGFDGVLMIPDARVFNSASVKHLLLWGVRNKKPVWGFSENVVKAGALAGVHCQAPAVGAQTAALVQEVLNGRQTSEVGLHYAKQAGYAVNMHTAKTIGAELRRETLGEQVKYLGEKR